MKLNFKLSLSHILCCLCSRWLSKASQVSHPPSNCIHVKCASLLHVVLSTVRPSSAGFSYSLVVITWREMFVAEVYELLRILFNHYNNKKNKQTKQPKTTQQEEKMHIIEILQQTIVWNTIHKYNTTYLLFQFLRNLKKSHITETKISVFKKNIIIWTIQVIFFFFFRISDNSSLFICESFKRYATIPAKNVYTIYTNLGHIIDC